MPDSGAPRDEAACAPSFRAALAFWFRLGCISFGGPAGQIALMHQELVERRRWISERRFLHALNYCMVLPGPEAQQLATYIGWLLHRTQGGLVAGGLFVLPSLLLLMLLSWVYIALGDQPVVAGLFYGIKPAVTAIVVQAAWRLGSRTLSQPWAVALAAAAFVAIFALHLPFPVIVIGAALVGWLGARLAPGIFQLQPAGSSSGAATAHGMASATASHAPAWIDDHTPPPAHARWNSWRLAGVLAAGALLWLLPMGLLVAGLGWPHTLPQMGWFFTKAALLTFGGAYAVLPYVWQGAVVHHGWLTPTQMIDGLALGESTPGPLIMVVAFVGFVGGYQQAALAAWFGGHPALAGAACAALVTWFTFLPSFVFILAGGPLVESTRGNLNLAAPLAAIGAAVVGVIVNLALFFAFHVFWPAGFAGRFDAFAAFLAAGAALALLVFKRGVIEVLLGCGVLGLVATRIGLA